MKNWKTYVPFLGFLGGWRIRHRRSLIDGSCEHSPGEKRDTLNWFCRTKFGAQMRGHAATLQPNSTCMSSQEQCAGSGQSKLEGASLGESHLPAPWFYSEISFHLRTAWECHHRACWPISGKGEITVPSHNKPRGKGSWSTSAPSTVLSWKRGWWNIFAAWSSSHAWSLHGTEIRFSVNITKPPVNKTPRTISSSRNSLSITAFLTGRINQENTIFFMFTAPDLALLPLQPTCFLPPCIPTWWGNRIEAWRQEACAKRHQRIKKHVEKQQQQHQY